MLWAWLILAVSLDTFIWNAVYFVTNIILAIPLFLAWLPIRLTKEEQVIYDQNFKLFFTKRHFKILFSYAQVTTYYSPIELATKGNPITNFIFVHFVSKEAEVLVTKDDVVIGSVANGHWVGIIDANSALNQENKTPVWHINCKITKATKDHYVNVVLFPVQQLKKVVFKNKKYGRDIEQTLEALWLEKNCEDIRMVRVLDLVFLGCVYLDIPIAKYPTFDTIL